MNGEDYRNYGNLLVKSADTVYSCDPDAEIIAVVSGSKSTHEKAIKRVSELIDAGKAENTLDKYFNIASALERQSAFCRVYRHRKDDRYV